MIAAVQEETELARLLEEQRKTDEERLNYILIHDEQPTERQYGNILQRFVDDHDTSKYNFESWVGGPEDDDPPELVFYANQKAHALFGQNALLDMHHDTLRYYRDQNALKNALTHIYETYVIH